jgi:hypothetical protein
VALQNRVTPSGGIIADPARGLFMGNRGILHDDARELGKARWRHRNSLAAGHRPCAECRRDRYRAFLAAWTVAAGGDGTLPKAPELDAALHAARVGPATRRQRTYMAELSGLPDGAFIRLEDAPLLVLGDRLLPWAPGGYGDAATRPSGGPVCVLTPRPTVAAMTAGYRPELPPGL